MALIRYFDPFKELEEMSSRLHHLMNQSFEQSGQTALSVPVADVYTEGEGDKQKLIVEAHLPNFGEDEVDVSIDQGALLIQAEHTEKGEEKQKRRYIVRESTSSFYRRIGLPKNVDPDKIDAEFEKGVLKVQVPFKELPQPKRVAIKGKK